MNTWLVLTATLPTHPSALRVRVWRALKTTGAGTLREGVYLLPSSAPTAQALWDIERLIQESGVDAHMLVVTARDDVQEKNFRGLFDRTELYTELLQSIKETRSRIKKASEAELHKVLRGLEQQLHAVQASDFFPDQARDKASAALTALRGEIERHLSPGEPIPRAEAIQRQALEEFQGRTWATRQRPWVDRLASAWLIQRFIDKSPKFIWLRDPKKCPKAALGFDFDDARFTHVGDKVTFEVLAHTFSLEADVGLQRLGELVHYIDIGGIPVDEAAGVETLVRGLQAQHDKDDALLSASLSIFDALYTALKVRP
ncbi:chromate resistance protein ChrB domain-containing protein [Rhodoferax ferrireducens]|uniref:chromate resistance protein ChrB domain-containing protein n=1 Tax=Rhodoferax ferrireducens TaxID=192843 RepID=UPI0013006F4E|nr:chromate resistance protein ChrB domain-containing protein [Rhodoferax ferrireducens]